LKSRDGNLAENIENAKIGWTFLNSPNADNLFPYNITAATKDFFLYIQGRARKALPFHKY